MKIKYKGSLPDGAVDWKGRSYNFKRGEWNDWPNDLVKELIGGGGDSWTTSSSTLEEKAGPSDTQKTKRGVK